jgi:hypothetical protein
MENLKNYTTLINSLSSLFQKKRTVVRGHTTLYSTFAYKFIDHVPKKKQKH